jgi:predicted DNA-binding protein YlxM (UPF0122 family)
MIMAIDTRWLPVSAAAELKGVGRNAIYNHLKRTQQGIAKQRLRYKVIGSMIFVSRNDVLALKIKKKLKIKEESK